MSPAELTLRASRAYRVWSDRLVEIGQTPGPAWYALDREQREAWEAAVATAITYTPHQRAVSQGAANATLAIAEAHRILGDLLERRAT